jgi:hypothetical protein
MEKELLGRFIGTFPDDEEVIGVRVYEGNLLICEGARIYKGDLVIGTNKATYRIPARTLPFLGIHPIRDWAPFLLFRKPPT